MDQLIRPEIILSFCGILFVIGGLIMTRRHFKLLKTFHFIERYNSSDITGKQYEVIVFLNNFNKIEDKELYITKFINSEDETIVELRIKIFKFLNLLQEVSAAYKMGILSEKAFILTFGSILPRYYSRFSEFIKENRKKSGDETLFKTLEDVSIKIDKKYKYNFIK